MTRVPASQLSGITSLYKVMVTMYRSVRSLREFLYFFCLLWLNLNAYLFVLAARHQKGTMPSLLRASTACAEPPVKHEITEDEFSDDDELSPCQDISSPSAASGSQTQLQSQQLLLDAMRNMSLQLEGLDGGTISAGNHPPPPPLFPTQ